MRAPVFEGSAWSDYEQLRDRDKKLHKVLCRQIQEMLRGDPAVGTGKPEPLRYELSGLWSRRLSQKDRLVYKFDDRYLYIFAIGIFAIGGHYDQLK
jgi:toxin YoeB